MSVENTPETTQAAQPTDKEINFAKVRQQLEQERNARQQAEERLAQLEREKQASAKPVQHDEDDDDDEPYIDKKRLNKKLSSFEKNIDEKIERKAEEKARAMLEAEKKENWLRNNADFYEIMQHADAFAQKDPELAETILAMPNTFERQKLVYKSIKAMGVHKKEEPKPSIQETIDRNRRSPYYQPTQMGAAPYAAAGDFSQVGQKNAYSKMQELKKRLGG